MHEKRRLSDVEPGQEVRILTIEIHPSATRLLAMGIRPGLRLRIARDVAFGHTLYLESGSQQYGIRRTEAAKIWVESVI